MAEHYDIQLVSVTKYFGEVTAVDNISLNVRPGEFLTLLGPSGCGKTTTLRMIGGFETPDSGRIFIQDKEVTNVPPSGRDTSMVFQDYALFPHMTVAENIAFGLQMRKVPRKEIKQRVEDALKLVNLPGLGPRKPYQLSGGQKQRVALARSLILQPAVLLLDEPLGALDAQVRKKMQVELKNLQKQIGQTFIYVTHDQEEALTMSDRIAIMRKGLIEQLDSPEQVYERPASPFVASFLGDCNLLEGKFYKVSNEYEPALFESPNLGVLKGRLGSTAVVQPNDPAVLCLRPEKITVKPTAAAAHAEHNGVTLEGTIKQRVYRGVVTRYIIAAGKDCTDITAETLGKNPIAPGENVVLQWNPEDAIIIPGILNEDRAKEGVPYEK